MSASDELLPEWTLIASCKTGVHPSNGPRVVAMNVRAHPKNANLTMTVLFYFTLRSLSSILNVKHAPIRQVQRGILESPWARLAAKLHARIPAER